MRREPSRLAPHSAPGRRHLSIALQGGGSFGAFTWGVLDRLLEDPGIDFDMASGSSAGAVNATLLASGLATGGREGARDLLERFWRRASGAAPAPPLSLALSLSSRMMSPYQFNPFDLNPLRSLLRGEIDFDRLRIASPIRLMIGATRVVDGRLHLFDEREVTADILLASACLPLLQQAVEIDGVAYWDGGYAANPPLIPLAQASFAPEILVVQIIPATLTMLPRTTAEIQRRLEHLTFNASLLRDRDILADMRAMMPEATHGAAAVAITTIDAQDHIEALDEKSPMALDWSFLRDLRDAGREAANLWLGGTADQRPSPAAQSASSPSRKVG